MDLLSEMLHSNEPFQKKTFSAGQVNGRTVIETDKNINYKLELDDSIKYATKYQRKERELYENYSHNDTPNLMEDVDPTDDLMSTTTRIELDALKYEQSREMFTKYRFDTFKTQQLLIDSYRDEIIRQINISDVVIVHGPTGCGKTTQVPQFILDDCKEKDKSCKIIVTQPRRIAAISVARRVCEERGWAVGQICGYQVGLENQTCRDTLLSYVTTGVLLQKLIKQKNLHEYTHIVVDEVHERNQDMDFLLLIIRRFLNTNSSGVKIILMSATFNTLEFAQYFRVYSSTRLIPSPIINISKESKFKKQIFFSEQLSLIGDVPSHQENEPKIDPRMYNLFVHLIVALDRLDPRDADTDAPVIGNVLVFLPGIYEIEEAHDKLVAYSKKNQEKEGKKRIGWHILPLHSSITTEEQRRVFQIPPVGMRKIILSTNIAESSITVPDIFYVVDFCLTKNMVVDAETQYQSLQLQWASHVNCEQRAGRVGRVANGRVYRLVSQDFYYSVLPKAAIPEMLRAPLHRLVLASKLLELNEPPKAILALAMNPPNLLNIDTTVLYLKQIGGLSLTCKGKKQIYDGDITFLGVIMANLPLDVHLSKLIILGYLFSCFDEAIIMATGCSLSTFKTPFKERLKAYSNRLLWADNSASDLIAYFNLYKVWQRQRLSGSYNKEKEWCAKNYVSQRIMKEWYILVKEIKDRLENLQIKKALGPSHIVLSESELALVFKVVFCGSFYPNFFKRCSDLREFKEREAVKILGGRDPFNTVYFTNFPLEQPLAIYAKHVKDYLHHCASNMEISFDGNTKIYVQFLNSKQKNVCIFGQNYIEGMPGKVSIEVYRSIQQRNVSLPLTFKILRKERAWKYAEEHDVKPREIAFTKVNREVDSKSSSQETSALPPLDIQFMEICVCQRIDASHFWAHNVDKASREVLMTILSIINKKPLKPLDINNFDISSYYAAKFDEDKLYYRCKIISLNALGDKRDRMAEIIYIDYGNTSTVDLNQLCLLPNHEIMKKPPQAIECYLSEIQPSIILNPRALWSEAANVAFDRKTENETFYAQIYSVINGIVRLRLFKRFQKSTQHIFENSLNNWFITEGYAHFSEESYLSKENNLKRLKVSENPENFASTALEEIYTPFKTVEEVPPPKDFLCTSMATLKGPFSPLEMTIYPITRGSSNKSVKIDFSSVNSVLLDTDPQDPHERLIVAAHISQNTNGNALSLRHTTMMPNIAGFPMLMSLLWCPQAEIKPTANGSQIAAVLCGLGTYPNSQKPVYPPLDISLALDSELTVNDINKINELRYWLNMSVQSMYANYKNLLVPTPIETCQQELKLRLFELLRLRRKAVSQEFVKNADIWGEFAYDADLLIPGNSGIVDEIWPLHSTIKLTEDADTVNFISKHSNDLKDVALGMQPLNEIVCLFCNVQLHSRHECRVHINSVRHKTAIENKKQNLS